jgi:transposase
VSHKVSQAGFRGDSESRTSRQENLQDATTKEVPKELIDRGVRPAIESGRPVRHVAEDLGIHHETLRRAVRQAEARRAQVCGYPAGRIGLFRQLNHGSGRARAQRPEESADSMPLAVGANTVRLGPGPVTAREAGVDAGYGGPPTVCRNS